MKDNIWLEDSKLIYHSSELFIPFKDSLSFGATYPLHTISKAFLQNTV